MFRLPDTPQAGLAFVAFGFLIAPGMDVFAKLLTANHAPGMVGVMRFATSVAILLVLISLLGRWSRPRPGHVMGGVFLGLALMTINAAFQVMPLANALAIFFVEPLVLTILSAIFLGEKIGWRRITAVLIGLIGALIVLRPNITAYGPSAAWPLATAVCFACYMMTTRVMTVSGNLLSMQFWMSLSAAGGLCFLMLIHPPALAGLVTPSLPAMSELWLVLGMGGLGVVAHQILAHGLKRAEASLIAPMQYLEIVSAILFGWWIFHDLPDLMTWVGTAVIVTSGIYVLHRERKVQITNAPDTTV
ncbi:MAG: DMT family transporter [Pseudomonadota bacterium]